MHPDFFPSVFALKLPSSLSPTPTLIFFHLTGILFEASPLPPTPILLVPSVWRRFTDQDEWEREEAKAGVGGVDLGTPVI